MSDEQSTGGLQDLSLPDDVFEEIQDHAPETVRDIEYLYGQLYVAYQREKYDAGENARYLTPDAASEALGTPDSLVAVDIDLTGSSPSYEGITVQSYERDMIDSVAHAKYSAGNAIDHSITHETGGGASPEKVAKYTVKRVSKWPFDDSIAREVADHPEYWVIEALQELGEDEDVVEQIREDVVDALSSDARRLITVRVRGAAGGDEWKYPGDIPLLMEGMLARRNTSLYTKGDTEDGRGDGVCYVTGEEETVYGGAEDPLRWYLTKQKESFRELDADNYWRTHPLSADAAVYVEKSIEFIEACRYTSSGMSFYVLPYFTGEQSRDRIEWLYRLLVNQLEEVKELEAKDSDDGRQRPKYIEEMYKDFPEDLRSELKMHIFCMEKKEDRKYKLVFAEFGADVLTSVDVAEKHQEAVQHIREDDWLPWPTGGGNGALDPGKPSSDYISLVTSPWYFMQVMPEIDADEVGYDEPHFNMNQRLLSGQPIRIEQLLDAYMEGLIDDWEPGNDDGDRFPIWTLALQYAQLVALSNAGLLSSNRDDGESLVEYYNPNVDGVNNFHEMIETMENDDGKKRTEQRKRTYEAFWDSHELLRENPERRAAFTFGALVGEVSRYQKKQGTNPLSKDMTGDAITKRNLSQHVTDVLDLVNVYSETSDVDIGGTMYSGLTDRLTDDLHHRQPEEWELSISDLRWHYSMGVAFGLNNYVKSDSKSE